MHFRSYVFPLPTIITGSLKTQRENWTPKTFVVVVALIVTIAITTFEVVVCVFLGTNTYICVLSRSSIAVCVVSFQRETAFVRVLTRARTLVSFTNNDIYISKVFYLWGKNGIRV